MSGQQQPSLAGISLHERVAAALDDAGQATGAELLSLLRSRHAGDPELMRELEELLGQEQAEVPVLDGTMTLGADASATRLRSAIASAAKGASGRNSADLRVDAGDAGPMPDHIGQYKVLRELGRGGMGVVYECEQPEPRRLVAVKVLRPGLGWSESQSGREKSAWMDSRREAQVLARLTHPGIVRVIEAGIDKESGRAFFAMDLVSGKAILQHAQHANLNVRERVELMARVCDAIEHAHRKGIIHRDIKPSNVLVEASDRSSHKAGGASGSSGDLAGEFAGVGQPRVMDFGVAKLTDPSGEGAAGRSLLLPGSSSIVGTLGYISPEALAGDSHNVDTRADVYALGVVLFELLAGQAPITLTGVPLSEVARRVAEVPVPLLRKFDSRLKGDLETIACKALEKLPERRYGSAGDLGDDLRRFLRKEPVIAQPASALYSARMFVARHRVVSALAASLLLALVAGLITTLVMYARVEKARAAEQTQREIAGAIREYLVQDMIGSASPDRDGKDAKIVDVLARLSREVGTRFPGQPELEGRVRQELANVFEGLGMYDEGIMHGQRALELLQPILGKDDPACVTTLSSLAMLALSKGEAVMAERWAREGLVRAAKSLEIDNPFHARLTAALGGSLHAQRKGEESLLVLAPLMNGIDTAPGLNTSDVAAIRLQYAAALQQAKPPRYLEAIEQYRAVITLYDKANNPASAAAIAARNNLVAACIKLRRYDEAMLYVAPLPDLVERSLPPEHMAHGNTSLTMSNVLAGLGRHSDALEWSVRAVDGFTFSLGDSTWQTERAMSIAAKNARAAGDRAALEKWAVQTAAARLRNAPRNEAPTTVKVFEEQGAALGESREATLARVLSDRDVLTPPQHPRRARFLLNLAWACTRMDRKQDARAARRLVEGLPLDDEERSILVALDEVLATAPK